MPLVKDVPYRLLGFGTPTPQNLNPVTIFCLYGGCPIFFHLELGACAVLARSLRELARAQFGLQWFSRRLITQQL